VASFSPRARAVVDEQREAALARPIERDRAHQPAWTDEIRTLSAITSSRTAAASVLGNFHQTIQIACIICNENLFYYGI
jgi:hypothetical protein